MRIAYFDCFSGISGDMILGALVDAGLPLEGLRQELAKLALPGWQIQARRVTRGGLAATQVEVQVAPEQPERRLAEVERILDSGRLERQVVEQARAIFNRLAQVEAKVHGIEPSEVHFHEVGAADALVDVVGSLVGLKLFGVERVYAAALRLGRGFVQCQHGTLPVPAPATMELLKGAAVEASDVDAELVTPTGAAIITSLARTFGSSPAMRLEQVGYGAGQRQLESIPNLLRVLIGQAQEDVEQDRVVVLECHIDDMSSELLGPVIEQLLAQGALDASLTPAIMKKGRPGVILTALATEDQMASVSRAIYRHTSTLGIRAHHVQRSKLPRHIRQIQTLWGPVGIKVAQFEGRERMTPEYEDCLRVAREHHLSLGEVYQEVIRLWKEGSAAPGQSGGQ